MRHSATCCSAVIAAKHGRQASKQVLCQAGDVGDASTYLSGPTRGTTWDKEPSRQEVADKWLGRTGFWRLGGIQSRASYEIVRFGATDAESGV